MSRPYGPLDYDTRPLVSLILIELDLMALELRSIRRRLDALESRPLPPPRPQGATITGATFAAP